MTMPGWASSVDFAGESRQTLTEQEARHEIDY
jgi:hypothetical protein